MLAKKMFRDIFKTESKNWENESTNLRNNTRLRENCEVVISNRELNLCERYKNRNAYYFLLTILVSSR